MTKSRVYLAGALLLASAGAAQADSFTVSPAVVSDYDFRGITQSANDPALQVGATYSHDSGIYVGAWSSNVNFGPGDPKIELDLTAGYTWGDAKESFAYDSGIVYYTYVSKSDFNYPEVYFGITKDWFNAKVFYSWDFAGLSQSAWYLSTTGTFPLPQDFSLAVHAGYSFGDYWDKAVQGNEKTGSYYDWSVGVTKALGNFTLGVSYIDGSNWHDYAGTNVFDTRGRIVGSITTTLPWAAK
jgi:uncharacterized protein (TIGR02001 family)